MTVGSDCEGGTGNSPHLFTSKMDPQTKQDVKYKTKNWVDAIGDKLDIGSAKLKGDDTSKLDVAVLKATLNDEVVPKEKHVVTLKVACGPSSVQQTNYVIHALAQRLDAHKGKWLVTLKTLIVFHRLLRESDPGFASELVRYAERTSTRRMLRLDTFADHTTKETWDFSAWVRVYSVFLDERLDVYRVMQFDPAQGDSAPTKLKACSISELLERMPLAHKLLSRLIACVPEGAAASNPVVVQACGYVLNEVQAVYRLVCEAVMNLCDKFFEMDRTQAAHGLELYKENVALNDRLNAFFVAINNVGTMRNSVQFPTLQALPADFVTTMEEYLRDAPRVLDPNDPAGANGGKAGTKPPADTRASNIALQGGTTSDAIAGTPGVTTVTLPPGTLKVGGPITSGPTSPTGPGLLPPPAGTVPSPKPADAPLLDLLGDDMGALSVGSVSSAPPAYPGAPAPAPGASPTQGAPITAMSSAPGHLAGPAPGAPGAVPPAPAAAGQPLQTVDSFLRGDWMAGAFSGNPAPAPTPAVPGAGLQQFNPAHYPAGSHNPAAYPGVATHPAPFPGAPPYPGAPAPAPYPAYPGAAPAAPAHHGAPPPAYPGAAGGPPAWGAPGGAAPYPPAAGPASPTPNPYASPSAAAPYPYAPMPGAGAPHPYGAPNPYAQAAAAPAPGPNPYAPNPYAQAPASAAANPFTAGGNFASPAAPGANPFSSPGSLTMAPPATASAPAPAWDRNHDPLSNLSIDILGKPSGYVPPQPTLKQLGAAAKQQ